MRPSQEKRNKESTHGGKEGIVLVDMLVLVNICVSCGFKEEFLFMGKVVFIGLETGSQQNSIFRSLFKICNTGEERLVLIVHVRVLKFNY